jgi:hypothetical protein
MHPNAAAEWVFAADSAPGHLIEQKEDRAVLAKWGNDLRQSFRTLAQFAGVSEFDARLLMNHAIPGVNAGYVTRDKLLEDHLRGRQQAISRVLMEPALKMRGQDGTLKDWLSPGCGARLRRQTAAATEPGCVMATQEFCSRPTGNEVAEVVGFPRFAHANLRPAGLT